MMRWKPLLFLTLCFFFALGSASALQRATRKTPAQRKASTDASSIRNVFWEPNTVIQGSPVFFTVELEKPASRVTGTWLGKSISFFHESDSKLWHALAGDDLEAQPGSYPLQITAVLAGGRISRSSKPVDIGTASFQAGAIDVPENFVDPDAEGKKLIAQAEVLKMRAYSRSAPSPLWSGNFASPVKSAPTDTFGESRILNEEKSSLHRGTDYPVPEGTLVLAANAGTVVLAKELFYEGNCVIVDHGQKLYTVYMHLQKMNVAAGDHVAKGAKLGVSGRTGRVTGPHLHVGVRWNGAYLDPVQLFKLTLPLLPENAKEAKRSSSGSAKRRRARR